MDRGVVGTAWLVSASVVLGCSGGGGGGTGSPAGEAPEVDAGPAPRSADPEWLAWTADGLVQIVDAAYDDPIATRRAFKGTLPTACDLERYGARLAPNHQRLLAYRDDTLRMIDLVNPELSGIDLGKPEPFGSPFGIGCVRWAPSSERVVVTFKSTYGKTSFLGSDGTVGPNLEGTEPLVSPRDDVFALCRSNIALYDMTLGASAEPQLVPSGPSSCVWSPKGDALVATTFVLPVASGKASAPVDLGTDTSAVQWLADGSHVIYQTGMGGLAARSWDGSTVGAPVALTPDEELVSYVTLGSQGIVYASRLTESTPQDLRVIRRTATGFGPAENLVGGFVLQPTNVVPLVFGGLRTAPDGSALAFRNDAGAVVLVDLQVSPPAVTVVGEGHPSPLADFDFSPDARWFRYRTKSGVAFRSLQAMSAGKEVVLPMDETLRPWARWSPRGRVALVTSQGREEERLSLFDPARPVVPALSLATNKTIQVAW